MRAIQITEFGGPEVLRLVDVPDPVAREPHLLVRVDAAGVNFADTHQTDNSYLAPQTLPLVPGAEVVGRTPDGRRVVALLGGGGGYAELAVAHPSVAFDVPDDVSDTTALGLVLQGTTAWHLLRTCAHLERGETVVVHAAAGGVGSLAVQLARQWGAGRVIATASSHEKRMLARELGADETLDPGGEDLADALREANGGRGVDIVLEMTGGRVFDASLGALGRFGRLVSYGMASREQPTPVAPAALMAKSQSVIGFWLVDALGRRGGLQPAMEELLSLASRGRLRVIEGGRYPLADAARAHANLRARKTRGKLVLLPSLDSEALEPEAERRRSNDRRQLIDLTRREQGMPERRRNIGGDRRGETGGASDGEAAG